MNINQKTIIVRHRRENLKKCSLSGLEGRSEIQFFTYPTILPHIEAQSIVLTPEASPLSLSDQGFPLILLDATWRLAQKMVRQLIFPDSTQFRSLPVGWRTAYPRRQDEFVDPTKGLASIEALYVAYFILGYNTEGLLDHYYWAKPFLEKNQHLLLDITPNRTLI